MHLAILLIEYKIPTVIAYIDGEAFRFGTEACELADNDTCSIAQWFKVSSLSP
jgi:hypothetical protein